ncbi:MAG: hypothetical protein KatS3mg087_1756 [Patescibacteria group bacterium]|nr:MAG: hypothetical protein KatS3mg087_1756 [Patescibacteria group bacterium]
MPALPIEGLKTELANPYEIAIQDLQDVSIESLSYRPRKQDVLFSHPSVSITSSTEAIEFVPNATGDEHLIPLRTDKYVFWKDKIIAFELESSPPRVAARAYHRFDTQGKTFYTLPSPEITRIESTFEQARINPSTVYLRPAGSNATTTMTYNPTTKKFEGVISGLSVSTVYEIVMSFQGTPLDLSDYNSVMIQALSIEGMIELDWDIVVFQLVYGDGTTAVLPFVSWGSRSGRIRFDNTNTSFADVNAQSLELDMSEAPKTNIVGLRIQWASYRNYQNWNISLQLYPDLGNPSSAFEYVRLNGRFATGLQTWSAMVSSIHQSPYFQDLLVRSPVGNTVYQFVGGGRNWTGNRFALHISYSLNYIWSDVINSQRKYFIVLSRVEGGRWIEVYEKEAFVSGESRTTIAGGSSIPNSGVNFTVTLNHPLLNASSILLSEGYVVAWDGTNQQLFRYVRQSNNQITIVERFGTNYSFPSGSHLFFLSFSLRVFRETITRTMMAGGSWVYGASLEMAGRVVIADPILGEIRISTLDQPLLYPTKSISPNDGFTVKLGNLPYALSLNPNGVDAYTAQYTYRVLIGETEQSTVVQRFVSPKPRSSRSIRENLLITTKGLYTNQQIVYPADYSESASQAQSPIYFTGEQVAWGYKNRFYLSDPTFSGFVKYLLNPNDSILWITYFDGAFHVLVRDNANDRRVLKIATSTLACI